MMALFGLSTAVSVFAAMIKVQAILVLLFLPTIILVDASRNKNEHMGKTPTNLQIFLTLIVTIIISFNPGFRIFEALAQGQILFYKVAIAAYILICIAFYFRITRLPWDWLPILFSAIAIGGALPFYLIYVSDNWWVPYSLINFVEFMSQSLLVKSGTTNSEIANLLQIILNSLINFLQKIFYSDQITGRDYPFQAVYLGALFTGFYALAVRKYQLAILTILFLAMALILPAIFGPRGYRFYYYLFAEPWAAIAFTLGASVTFNHLFKFHTFSFYPVKTLLIFLSLIVGGIQVRYQAIAPSTGSNIALSHVCCYVNYAEKIGHHLIPICESTDKLCHINWNKIIEKHNSLRREF